MRTINIIALGLIGFTFTACGHRARGSLLRAEPAPPDSAAAERTWQTVRIDDAYGSFEMRVPSVRISPADGGTVVVDSSALRQVEKRLTSRMAGIARAAAAALRDTANTAHARYPAPEIKPGLLATVQFHRNEVAPDSSGLQRIAAAARLADDVAGDLELVAIAAGTTPAVFDIAITRARQVYLALVAAEPSLRDRPVSLTVRTEPALVGAPERPGAVDVYVKTVTAR